MPKSLTVLMAVTVATLAAGCQTSTVKAAQAVAGAPQTTVRAGEWRSLVDGNSLAAWRGYKRDTVPAGWSATDGVVSKTRPVADIVTRDEFGDFELSLEWKISKGGNAGVFYRGTEEYDRIYWTAPEYQLLDDDNTPDGENPLTRAATAYGLYARTAGELKPVGEWNEARIIARGAHVEHWLNGIKTIEYDLWSPDWLAKVKASKFSEWPNYGLAKRGRIALQGDHLGRLDFRNVKIRELP